jgi:hypothetical protein
VIVLGRASCRDAQTRATCGARTALSVIVTAFALGAAGTAVASPSATSAGPSRSVALRYAERTYIEFAGKGHVAFTLGASRVVTAGDGSTITAFAISNDPGGTADSESMAVMFFRGTTFLGWASSRASMSLTLEPSSGDAIRVLYPIWKPADATCCPSGRIVISYTWNGSRILASAAPPLIYGEPGVLLHLSPG